MLHKVYLVIFSRVQIKLYKYQYKNFFQLNLIVINIKDLPNVVNKNFGIIYKYFLSI